MGETVGGREDVGMGRVSGGVFKTHTQLKRMLFYFKWENEK